MKKLLAILICTAMLTGCGGSKSPTSKNVEQQPQETKTASTPTPKADKSSANVSDADIVKAIEEYVNQEGVTVDGLYNVYKQDGELLLREDREPTVFTAKLSDIELLEIKEGANGNNKAVMMCSIGNDFLRLSDRHTVETSFSIADGGVVVYDGTKITSKELLLIEPTVPWDDEFLFADNAAHKFIKYAKKVSQQEKIDFNMNHEEVKEIEVIYNSPTSDFKGPSYVRITLEDGLIGTAHVGISYRPDIKDWEKNNAGKTRGDFKDSDLWLINYATEFHQDTEEE